MASKIIALRDHKADFYSVDDENAKNAIAKLFAANTKRKRHSVEEFLKDKELLLYAIRIDSKYIDDIPNELLSNKKFVIEALGYSNNIYKNLSNDFKKDKDIIIAALKGGLDFYYVPDEKKKDRNIVIAAIKQNPIIFDDLDDIFKDDKEIALIVIEEKKKNYYRYLSDRLKKDKDICLATLASFSYELKNMPKEILEDKEFIKVAVSLNWDIFECIPDKFKKDKEVAEIALSEYAFAYEYLPDELKADKEFILKMIETNIRLMEYAKDILSKEEKIELIKKTPETLNYLDAYDLLDKDILTVIIETYPEIAKEFLDEMRFSTDFDEYYTEETYKAELFFKSVYDEVMGRKKFKEMPKNEEKPVNVVVQGLDPEPEPGMRL